MTTNISEFAMLLTAESNGMSGLLGLLVEGQSVTNSDLSCENSTVEYVLGSIQIQCGISISSRLAFISGKVNSFTVDSN